MPSSTEVDRISYRTWQTVQQTVESPLDRVGAFWKYVLSAYCYYRSRLVVPGRAYHSDADGMLAIGGSAHCDVMDLEVVVAAMSAEARDDAYEWTLGSSQEQIAHWRGLIGPKEHRSTLSRRRDRLVEEIAAQNSDLSYGVAAKGENLH